MYKAFVSSTFQDLRMHRAEAIEALRAAGFVVDPMEDNQADHNPPKQFCVDRLDGCKLCILLVAFRRGHIPDGDVRSLTQIEYDEAIRRGIDVLPFLLEDQTRFGEGGWNRRFDDRESDAKVNQWREALRQAHGSKEFSTNPKSVRIEASIARWVVRTEMERATRFRQRIYRILMTFLCIGLALVGYILYASFSPLHRSKYLSRFLEYHDPSIFNHRKTGAYDIARVLPNNASLNEETDINEEIDRTKETFDILANTAGLLNLKAGKTIESIIIRGVNVRMILWDYTETNRVHYDAFARSVKEDPLFTLANAKEIHKRLDNLQEKIALNKTEFKGSLQIRWNSNVLQYAMWIRDGNHVDAIGHLSMHFYQGKHSWPCFRVSKRDGDRTMRNITNEFKVAWDAASTNLVNRRRL
jgi:Domain of unknown function (DUF4062)